MADLDYHRAENLAEALHILATRRGRAWLLAGGTDLLVDMRAGKLAPRFVLDIGRIVELAGIRVESDHLWIGSTTSLSSVASSPLILQTAAVLAQAASQIGSPQIRNQGTLGGNLMAAASLPPCAIRPHLRVEQWCDRCVRQCRKEQPGTAVYGDTVTALMALDAKVCLRSTDGTRVQSVENFLNRFATERRVNELISGVIVPLQSHTSHWYYIKIGLRRALSVSLFNLAIVGDFIDGYCRSIRIAVGQMGPTVQRVRAAEDLLEGQQLHSGLIKKSASVAAAEGEPISDVRATNEYRRRLCQVWIEEALHSILRKSIAGREAGDCAADSNPISG